MVKEFSYMLQKKMIALSEIFEFDVFPNRYLFVRGISSKIMNDSEFTVSLSEAYLVVSNSFIKKKNFCMSCRKYNQ